VKPWCSVLNFGLRAGSGQRSPPPGGLGHARRLPSVRAVGGVHPHRHWLAALRLAEQSCVVDVKRMFEFMTRALTDTPGTHANVNFGTWRATVAEKKVSFLFEDGGQFAVSALAYLSVYPI